MFERPSVCSYQRTKGNASCNLTDFIVDKYDALLSRRRMEEHGFSPQVTRQSAEQLMSAWSRIAAQSLSLSLSNVRHDIAQACWEQHRSTINHTMVRTCSKNTHYGHSLTVFQGFSICASRETYGHLAYADEENTTKQRAKDYTNVAQSNSISGYWDTNSRGTCHPGSLCPSQSCSRQQEVLESRILQYRKTSNCSQLIAGMDLTGPKLQNTWNFMEEKFDHSGYAKTFVATCPEYAIGEITAKPGRRKFVPAWFQKAKHTEKELIETLRAALRISVKETNETLACRSGKGKGKDATCDVLPPGFEKYVARVQLGLVRDFKTLHTIGQFNKHALPWSSFKPRFSFAAVRLQSTCKYSRRYPYSSFRFSNQGIPLPVRALLKESQSITVLDFQKIPLLDRRLVAIVLRACPNIVKLGIYDCPLIHFGDVLPLLDLIYEVNQSRKLNNQPEIEAFDFFPHYHDDTQSNDGLAYGIMAKPEALDLVQRGLYAILLKAFTKSMEMGLGCLFDADCAFRGFLQRVPNPPLSIPCFLDGLYRYSQADKKRKGKSYKMRALYDILKPVRFGLEHNMDNDWPNWYKSEMGQRLVFCSSCGYKMPPEFYRDLTLSDDTYYKVCCGCKLQYYLDHGIADRRGEKVTAITGLCPHWKGRDFNEDAPIPFSFRALTRLHTTRAAPAVYPQATLRADGTIHAVNRPEALARNNKVHDDSLQNLPNLQCLLSKSYAPLWTDFIFSCRQLDILNITEDAREVERIAREGRQGLITSKPSWNPSSYEPGPDQSGQQTPAFNFFTASEFQRKGLHDKEW